MARRRNAPSPAKQGTPQKTTTAPAAAPAKPGAQPAGNASTEMKPAPIVAAAQSAAAKVIAPPTTPAPVAQPKPAAPPLPQKSAAPVAASPTPTPVAAAPKVEIAKPVLAEAPKPAMPEKAPEPAILTAPSPVESKAPAPAPVSEPKEAAPQVAPSVPNVIAPEPVIAPKVEPAPPEAAPPAPPAPAEPVRVVSQPPLLFECAWEVCWQLGGIYTVLKTKASCTIDTWGDRYCLIGPYNPATAAVEFEEQPTYGSIRDALQRLRDELGLICHFGRWLIPGRPRVILIDYRSRFGNLHVDKFLMFQDHGISLPADDGEMNDVIAFGFAVTEFFRVFSQIVKDRTILAHFHEWMGGVAVPRIAHLRLPVTTVFTTHATLLGRYLAGDNPYFYDHLPFLNPDAEAQRYNIYSRFAIERAAAHASTVFTTVSEVTSYEAEKLLGRTPDYILPNGLNIQKFAAPHEFQALHSRFKERINEFVMGHFFPSYTFDLDRTIYLFTSGRYEYRNKGMDLYIEAMRRLNDRLREMKDPPTVVSFIITRAQTKHVNVDVLRNHTMFEDMRNTCKELQEQMGTKLFQSAASGRLPTYAELMPEDSQVRLKRAMHAWRSNRQPLIVTHDLMDDANDPIVKHLRHRQMFNAQSDPVKMVFHPDFVSLTSPTISLDYEQFVRGCHMGIFPSYYEPWGYTPMECVALGIPAVTTDLSGFGAYVQRNSQILGGRRAEDQGILVLPRRYKGFDEAADRLADYLFNFVNMTRRQRIELRNRVERIGEQFDWSVLIKHYNEAHNLALERVGAKKVGSLEVRAV